jgi:hypothetical protein
MAMPEVHIVAYCNDLGYGTLRGAQMLSTMLAFGVAIRLISGTICDRIGGVRKLMIGSALQDMHCLFSFHSTINFIVCDFGTVWAIPRRHRIGVYHHCPRVFRLKACRCKCGYCDHGDLGRHGIRRVDEWDDF